MDMENDMLHEGMVLLKLGMYRNADTKVLKANLRDLLVSIHEIKSTKCPIPSNI
jgi:hypothetical protein